MDHSVELYLQGVSTSQIHKITGVSMRKLYRLIDEAGIPKNRIPGHRKYHVNHIFFNTIDNEQKAYWLGFIYADGCIVCSKAGQKCLNVTIKNTDAIHLEKLKVALDATYPIKSYDIKGFNGVICPSVRLLVTSAQIFDDLKTAGAVQRKSLILRFPSSKIVPDDLVHHFIRGYFDGDGSFAKHGKTYKFKVAGTKSFLLNLSSVLGYKAPNLDRRKGYTKNNYALQITGRKQVVGIGNFMYKNSTIYLNRKHERYLRCQNIKF